MLKFYSVLPALSDAVLLIDPKNNNNYTVNSNVITNLINTDQAFGNVISGAEAGLEYKTTNIISNDAIEFGNDATHGYELNVIPNNVFISNHTMFAWTDYNQLVDASEAVIIGGLKDNNLIGIGANSSGPLYSVYWDGTEVFSTDYGVSSNSWQFLTSVVDYNNNTIQNYANGVFVKQIVMSPASSKVADEISNLKIGTGLALPIGNPPGNPTRMLVAGYSRYFNDGVSAPGTSNIFYGGKQLTLRNNTWINGGIYFDTEVGLYTLDDANIKLASNNLLYTEGDATAILFGATYLNVHQGTSFGVSNNSVKPSTPTDYLWANLTSVGENSAIIGIYAASSSDLEVIDSDWADSEMTKRISNVDFITSALNDSIHASYSDRFLSSADAVGTVGAKVSTGASTINSVIAALELKAVDGKQITLLDDYMSSNTASVPYVVPWTGDVSFTPITYVGNTAVNATPGTTLDLAVPLAATTNDFMIATVQTAGTGAGNVWTTAASGWTRLFSNCTTQPTQRCVGIFYKKHNGSEASPITITNNTGTAIGAVGQMQVFRGVDVNNPFEVTFSNATHMAVGVNDANSTNLPITVLNSNSLIVLLGGHAQSSGTSYAAPSTFELIANAASRRSNMQLFGAYKTRSANGVESPGVWGHVGALSIDWWTSTLALREGSVDTTPAYNSYQRTPISLVGVTAANRTASVNSIGVPIHVSAQKGDILVTALNYKGDDPEIDGGELWFANNTVWQPLYTGATFSNYERLVGLFYKVHNGAESANAEFYNNTTGGFGYISALMSTFRGVDANQVLDIAFDSTNHQEFGQNDETPVTKALTTSNTNSVVLVCGVVSGVLDFSELTAYGAPSGYTLATNTQTSTGATNAYMAYKTITNAGLETPGSWTHTGDSTIDWWGATIALKESNVNIGTDTASLSTSSHYKGNVGPFGIYNRVLSNAEIKELYETYKGRF